MTIVKMTSEHILLNTSESIGDRLGAVYLKTQKLWRLPHNLGAVRELMQVGYDLQEHHDQLKQRFNTLVEWKSVPPDPGNSKLRPYQLQDVHFLSYRDTLGVFNEQRTGKSPTMCSFVNQHKRNTIIICPASLVLNWADELSRWSPDMNIYVAKGTPKQRIDVYAYFSHRETGQVLIVSKEIAKADLSLIHSLNYSQVIVDEAHFLRNYRSKQSEAVYKIGKHATYRYALTGTPATNKPDDVFGIFKFLKPDTFTSYWQFVDRYFKVTDGYFGKEVGLFKNDSRKREYYELMELNSIQRKRKEVMQWLPDKQYQKVNLEMSKSQTKAYQSMLETFNVIDENDNELDASTVLAQLTRLRQITLDPKIVGLEKIPSAKKDFILDWLKQYPSEKVVIFSNFTSFLKVLQAQLPDAKTIIGDDSKEQRQANIKDFQNGDCNTLLCNIQAAGTGLTLDAAGTVIFMDRAFTPTDNMQAEDRIVPTTEHSNMSTLIIDLVCKNSVDEKILEMVGKKVNITQIANNYKSVKDFLGR